MADTKFTLEGDLIGRLRERLLTRGHFAICSLAVAFRALGKERVDGDEFQKGIQRYNELCLIRHKLDFLPYEVASLFKLFDKDCEGKVAVQDFLVAVRFPMSKKRTESVVMVFEKLDKSGSGSVSVSEVRNMYTMTRTRTISKNEAGETVGDKTVVSEETVPVESEEVSQEVEKEEASPVEIEEASSVKTEDASQVESEETIPVESEAESEKKIMHLLPLPFLVNPTYDFVTLHEFLDFYSGVSATIHQDALFDLLMKRAWGM